MEQPETAQDVLGLITEAYAEQTDPRHAYGFAPPVRAATPSMQASGPPSQIGVPEPTPLQYQQQALPQLAGAPTPRLPYPQQLGTPIQYQYMPPPIYSPHPTQLLPAPSPMTPPTTPVQPKRKPKDSIPSERKGRKASKTAVSAKALAIHKQTMHQYAVPHLSYLLASVQQSQQGKLRVVDDEEQEPVDDDLPEPEWYSFICLTLL